MTATTDRSPDLVDYITGLPVRDTPEEREAVQVFARRLVEDYGYSKSVIQTHPQFRVRARPSDSRRSFPVDIAVFTSDSLREDDLYMVVECKRSTRKDGLAQLKLYLDMSPAEIGVWFNGEDHAYVRKVHHRNGQREYQELPNIPRAGQAIEDIGKFARRDLVPPSNLKAVFRDIRNHLAGNVTGITRDEALAQQLINLLFCKIYDEINTPLDAIVNFRVGHEDSAEVVRSRISALFDNVRHEYVDVFAESDEILLDDDSLHYVVGELQNYCLVEADRDAVGEAFEVFIGPALRGAEGQFFTPRNVVRMIIEMLDPKPGETVIDPACGSGGFLIMALEYVWQSLERDAEKMGWSADLLERRRREVADRCFRGIDKDAFLAKVTKAYMAIIGDGRSGVYCENSLLPPTEWHHSTQDAIALGTFDVVVTNPPFGSKIRVKGEELLSQYDLAYKWQTRYGETSRSDVLRKEHTPHILFLERCLQLLRPGGRLGIVLPESILGNPSYQYVMQFLQERCKLRAVVTLPEPLFKTSGKGGTHTKVAALILEKNAPGDSAYSVFMSDVRWCGHDSRGNPTIRVEPDGSQRLLDEVPEVAPLYNQWLSDKAIEPTRLGFNLKSAEFRNGIFVPKYYEPEIAQVLDALAGEHDLISIAELCESGALTINTGVEVGKMAYGTGPIPFVRTSDLSNWEIKTDFKHGVSEAVFEEHEARGACLPGDVLLVRDGTYLIGTSAIVTEADVPMLLQSHIYRIRVSDNSIIDPWLLLVLLNTRAVKLQIRSKQFTQDIIDTLGGRINEIVLPIPKSADDRRDLSNQAREIVQTRVRLREEARALPLSITRQVEIPEELVSEEPA